MLRPLLAVGALSLASAAQPRQNVLFIVCDDLRTEALAPVPTSARRRSRRVDQLQPVRARRVRTEF